MRGDVRGRAKSAQRIDPARAALRGGTQTLPAGLTWPLRGFRPAIPVEVWRPESLMGLPWGAQETTWEIVALVYGAGSVWAAEVFGPTYPTGTDEPDWSSGSPVSDDGLTWYQVTSPAVLAWSSEMDVDDITFLAAAGHVWVSVPGYTGQTDTDEPDWESALPGDFIDDGDVRWWPFPLAEETITLDPLYGRVAVKTLPGFDGLRVTDGSDPSETSAVTTAVTPNHGVRFDGDGSSVFLVGLDGSGVVVFAADDFAEHSAPDTTKAVTMYPGSVSVYTSVGGAFLDGDSFGVFGAAMLASFGMRLLLKSDPAASSPAASANIASTVEVIIDEGSDLLTFRVVYADGSTVKTGGIPLA